MAQESVSDLFIQALNQIFSEIISFLPNILFAIIIFVFIIVIIRILNRFFNKILKIIKLDNTVSNVTKLPFSVSRLIIILIDIGILLIGLFVIVDFFLGPTQTALVNTALEFTGRLFSIIGVTILAFVIFTMLINRMTMQTRMKSYIILIILILLTVMIIDLTSLSPSIKDSLASGMSLGLGISIGVFAIWFFFHDYLDKLLSVSSDRPESEHEH